MAKSNSINGAERSSLPFWVAIWAGIETHTPLFEPEVPFTGDEFWVQQKKNCKEQLDLSMYENNV